LVSDTERAQREGIIPEDVIDEILGSWNAGLAEKLAYSSTEPATLWIDQLAL